MTLKHWASIAVIILACAQPASAGQSVSTIAAAAAVYAQERATQQGHQEVTVNVRPLDSRLNLTQCAAPLKVSSSGERALGPVSVAVKCVNPAPWTVHVRATVTAAVALPVLTAAMNRGDIIGPGDVEWRTQQVSRDLVGYLVDDQKIFGKELRKHLRSGSPLRASDLMSPQIVDRGQTVDLVAQSAGLVVNMQGKALANGSEGDRLLVKNLSSGKRVEGLVLASGTVLIQ